MPPAISHRSPHVDHGAGPMLKFSGGLHGQQPTAPAPAPAQQPLTANAANQTPAEPHTPTTPQSSAASATPSDSSTFVWHPAASAATASPSPLPAVDTPANHETIANLLPHEQHGSANTVAAAEDPETPRPQLTPVALATANPNITPAGFVGMYNFEEELGRGHFSIVKKAQHVLSKDMVAVKIIDKTTLQDDELDHLHHEVRVMKLIRHPHVIRLYQVCNTNTKLYLILELGEGGDLYEYLTKNGKMDEPRAQRLFRQIAEAVAFCHQHHIAHRDLKPENCVFATRKHEEEEETIKVTDFGLSNDFKPGEKMKTACGSLCYSCPEVLLQEPYDGPLADIWSLGVILFMMVTGRLPFQEPNDYQTITKIVDVKFEIPAFVSNECKDLISRLLVKEPSDRISLAEILAHPWLEGVVINLPSATPYANGRPVISDEQHERILATMSAAGLDPTKVTAALDNRSYDYLASTYFLLAEREVRRNKSKMQRAAAAGAAAAIADRGSAARRSPRSLSLRRTQTVSTPRSVESLKNLTHGSLRRPRRRPAPLTLLHDSGNPHLGEEGHTSSDEDVDVPSAGQPTTPSRSLNVGLKPNSVLRTPAHRRQSLSETTETFGLSPRYHAEHNFDNLAQSPPRDGDPPTPKGRRRGMQNSLTFQSRRSNLRPSFKAAPARPLVQVEDASRNADADTPIKPSDDAHADVDVDSDDYRTNCRFDRCSHGHLRVNSTSPVDSDMHMMRSVSAEPLDSAETVQAEAAQPMEQCSSPDDNPAHSPTDYLELSVATAFDAKSSHASADAASMSQVHSVQDRASSVPATANPTPLPRPSFDDAASILSTNSVDAGVQFTGRPASGSPLHTELAAISPECTASQARMAGAVTRSKDSDTENESETDSDGEGSDDEDSESEHGWGHGTQCLVIMEEDEEEEEEA